MRWSMEFIRQCLVNVRIQYYMVIGFADTRVVHVAPLIGLIIALSIHQELR